MFHLSHAFFLLSVATFASTMTTFAEARYMASYKAKGVGASASASLDGDDECSYGCIGIDGSSSAVKEKSSQGQPTTSYNKFTYAYYSVYNYCTNEELYGYAEVYPSTFTGDKNSATASATITSFTRCFSAVGEDGCEVYTCEESSTPVELTIDATWTATGSASKNRSTSSYGSKSFSYKSRYSGTSRDTTVSMQVTMDGEAIDLDPSSVYGTLYSSMSGDVYLDRYEY